MNNDLSIRKDWKLIESLINSNSRVLDIGCGEGGFVITMYDSHPKLIVGLDKLSKFDLTNKTITGKYFL